MDVVTVHIQSNWATASLREKLTEYGFAPSSDDGAGEVGSSRRTHPPDEAVAGGFANARNGRLSLAITVCPEDYPHLIDCLTAFTLEDWKRQFVQHYLAEEFKFLRGNEVEYLALLTSYAVQNRGDADSSGIPAALDEIGAQLRTAYGAALASQWLDVNGIVQFRAKGFIKLLQQVASEMVSQFLSDREYEEFVSTLRYLLDANPPSRETLHVFCTDERVWICDNSGDLYTDSEVERAARLATGEEDVNAEDLTMSILVTKSPCRIVIHDLTQAAPWPSFAETCERVFLQRAERCNHCSMCQNLAGGQLQ